MPPAEKCDFECAAAGVASYLGCAGVCAKSLNYTAAVLCVTNGCPLVVAASTEACLKKNPLCQHALDAAPQCNATDVDIWENRHGRDNFEKYMPYCGGKCHGIKACVSQCVQQEVAYSKRCSDCFGSMAQCGRDHCAKECSTPGDKEECKICNQEYCVKPLYDCTGFHKIGASLDTRATVGANALAAFEQKLEDGSGRKPSAASTSGAIQLGGNACALRCTLASIGVYWGCALGCVEKSDSTQCITVACPAIVTATDAGCLNSCKRGAEANDAAVQFV
jgi:hypothetical protein